MKKRFYGLWDSGSKSRTHESQNRNKKPKGIKCVLIDFLNQKKGMGKPAFEKESLKTGNI